MEFIKKKILRIMTTGTTTGCTPCNIIIPDTGVTYNFKICLKCESHDFGFFDTYEFSTVPITTTTTTINPIITTTTTNIPISTTTTTNPQTIYAQYVVLISMDGARFSETWETPSNIPNIISIANNGFVNTNFYTIEPSSTIPGHTAMVTGLFDPTVLNDGSVNPTYPSYLQEWLYSENILSNNIIGFTNKAKIIFSKDKLYCLGKSKSNLNDYLPYINAGVNGDGTGGYRADSLTHELFKIECLGVNPPNLSVISYAEPDTYAHNSDWNGYVDAIQQTDSYIGEIWSLIQSHPLMANNTILVITNDHGRKTPDFENHGGSTDSECHVLFVGIGPNINNGVTNIYRELIDIPITLLKLINVNKIYNSGSIMNEMLNL